MLSTSVSKKRFGIDLVLLVIVLSLMAMGLIALYSASLTDRPWHRAQLSWFLLGSGLATVVAVIDYRFFERHAYVIYALAVVSLILVLFVGVSRNNATRWLDVGVFNAQPSEAMKVAIIFVTARYLHDNPSPGGYHLTSLLIPFFIAGVPLLLIAAQPDLGTALVVLAIFFSVVLFAGIQKGSLLLLGLGGLVSAIPAWFWGLQDYQKTRITSFLNPEGLHHESGWQVQQSIIAVASGGFSGKGHTMGTQVQSGFVPENENDFIFAHIGEEFGFLGAALLLLLYAALIIWSLRIARHARDRFGVLLAVGIAAFFFWHVVINVGMVLGLLPVVGLWLPFVSYGGSSTLTVMVCVGLLMNLSVRRHVFRRS